MDRGLSDAEHLLGALMETATRLEICITSLHRAVNLADKLCRLTGFPKPELSVDPQFWHDLTELRHAIEHSDARYVY
jgi:hypothetical protein